MALFIEREPTGDEGRAGSTESKVQRMILLFKKRVKDFLRTRNLHRMKQLVQLGVQNRAVGLICFVVSRAFVAGFKPVHPDEYF